MKQFLLFILALLLLQLGCTGAGKPVSQVNGKNIRIEFDKMLHSRIVAKFAGKEIRLGNYSPSEFVSLDSLTITDFPFVEEKTTGLNDNLGSGKAFSIIGENQNIRKEVSVRVYDAFPDMALFSVTYTNTSKKPVVLKGWTNHSYQIETGAKKEKEPPFWSYQSGSYESRPDWVLPLKPGFSQQNYMGMNASDYGGGTPVSDVWRRDVGLAVGHVEPVPRLVSLPVKMPDARTATVAVECKINRTLKPDESFRTYRTFVAVHRGDYFHTLAEYRKVMMKSGIHFDKPPQTSYEPIWCAWGFERNFTVDQIYRALPEVKKLGFKWAVLDDGWQTAEGDWYLVKNKFPRGDRDMRKLVDKIHSMGLKAKLWWAPLAVDPGTDLIKNHPEYVLLNRDGSKQDISWWDAYYLCPAYPPVQEYTRRLVGKFMKTWGFDGLKIDGQHLNAAPPCYNPAHHHARPEEAFEKVPEFFRVIYQTAMEINPEAVVEICPCGTAYAFHTMPYMNQPVASDPESSWQIRLKGKTFKALMGPQAPYYGDHVELSDGKDDFASTVGIGGVIGTKFTWPVGSKSGSKIDLTPEKEKTWQKWVNIYRENMLPLGEYSGELYDLGFDRPEAHAIRKDGKMYYAFYADKFSGTVELRGLDNKSYRITDYENNRDLGTVNGPVGTLTITFHHHLLLEAIPE
ncbi:MAG TPA: alpha-galactosidase [Caldithrix sp.]|nr:alpha-galactosidase [Caldithrix sp.]